MNMQTQKHRSQIATILLGAVAMATVSALIGCSGAGQSEVTQEDRPAEGAGWAVQEQMAGQQGQ